MRCKLGNIIKINQYTYTSHDQWKYVNYLDTGNITKNVIDTVQYINLSKEVLPSRARRKVKKNSILYSMVRPNQSHYGIVKDNIDNFLVSTGFAVIDVDTNKTCPAFIYYMLTQQKMTEHLQAIAEQSVSAYPSIKPSDIENLDIILPGLLQQQKIAKLLGALDDKIELNRQINTNLEQQAQAIFKSWFIDFEPFGGIMPEDWNEYRLGDFLPVVTGKKNANISSEKGRYPFFSCSQAISWTDEYSFDANAILVAGNGDFNVKWYNGKFEAYQRTYVLIPTISRYTSWLYYAVKFHLSEITKAARGSVINFITKGNLEDFRFIGPKDINNFTLIDQFTAINSAIDNNIKEIYTLSSLRDSLLPKLMSGEIDVSKIELI